MPVAIIYPSLVLPPKDNLVDEWAKSSGVDKKDITIVWQEKSLQIGNRYKLMVNLHLPSIWSSTSIDTIQLSLLDTLIRSFDIAREEVFIVTTIISSGHVIENGSVQEW